MSGSMCGDACMDTYKWMVAHGQVRMHGLGWMDVAWMGMQMLAYMHACMDGWLGGCADSGCVDAYAKGHTDGGAGGRRTKTRSFRALQAPPRAAGGAAGRC
eukprot:364491-Chlamydomonas_euryale.AAC.10